MQGVNLVFSLAFHHVQHHLAISPRKITLIIKFTPKHNNNLPNCYSCKKTLEEKDAIEIQIDVKIYQV